MAILSCHVSIKLPPKISDGQEISKQNFRPIPMLIPEGSVIDRFTALVRPLYERITANMRESLTSARFTLGLRTHGTCEARLFSLKSEFRLQPESKPR